MTKGDGPMKGDVFYERDEGIGLSVVFHVYVQSARMKEPRRMTVDDLRVLLADRHVQQLLATPDNQEEAR